MTLLEPTHSQRTILWLALLPVAASARALHAQDKPRFADDVSISVITFGRGDAVHQYFGHNAFVVARGGLARPTVFNYGMFSFGPDMIPQFLMGRLHFWVGTSDLERTAASYAAANRDVRVLELNLSAQQRRAVLARLVHDIQPEHSKYLYDHYFDNCSTKVRDVLDQALHGQLRAALSQPAKFTLREETRRYTQHDWLTEWSMMLALNGSVDKPLPRWDDAFLPLELEPLLEAASYLNDAGERVPLVSSKRTIFSAHRPAVAAQPGKRWPTTLTLGVIIGLCYVLLGALAGRGPGGWRATFIALAAAYGLLGGVLGILLFHLAFFSDHNVAHGNLNLLLLNPITFLAGLCSLAAGARAAWPTRLLSQLWAALGVATLAQLALKILPLGIVQDISLPATLLAPINLGLALACLRLKPPTPNARDTEPHQA
jgi:hypothetical protein